MWNYQGELENEYFNKRREEEKQRLDDYYKEKNKKEYKRLIMDSCFYCKTPALSNIENEMGVVVPVCKTCRKDIETMRHDVKKISINENASPVAYGIIDPVNHPTHYTSKNGVECIDVTEMFNFCRGNAIKYIWRAGEKDKTKTVEDLKKAIWYIEREIKGVENDRH